MRTHKTAARRWGISLAEVAVALAVIMIVSAATATFLVRAVDTETEVATAMARNEQVENVIECYRWANGDADAFKTALIALGYQTEDDLIFQLSGTGYTMEVTVTLSGTDSTKLSTIQISDGEEVYYV